MRRGFNGPRKTEIQIDERGDLLIFDFRLCDGETKPEDFSQGCDIEGESMNEVDSCNDVYLYGLQNSRGRN